MPGLADLDKLQARKEAILSGLRDLEAEYPELSSSVGDFERDAQSPSVGDFSKAGSYGYEYKDPGAAGAAEGDNVGPMASELKGIPGVVKPGPDGMDRVDTGRLSLANAGQTGENVRDIEKLRRRLDALQAATSGEGALSAAQSGRF